MNLFILHNDVKISAQSLCDKHVVKMLLETAQLLTSQFEPGDAPYKRTHYNHPCSAWCRQNKSNYEYLIQYGVSLAEEYTFRYGKTHKSLEIIKWCEQHKDMLQLPDGKLTAFAQAMPQEYKHSDPVTAYRAYYIHDKSDIAKWNNGRNPPSWWTINSMTSIIDKLWN